MATISQEIRKRVAERDGILNPSGYELHHCFFHSELDGELPKEELEQEWNYQAIRRGVHACIHNGSSDEDIVYGHKMELYCKRLALSRYSGKYRHKLEEILNRKIKHYGIFS
jgi:hypothetical protein